MSGESPRRIAYQEATQTFGVLTYRVELKSEESHPSPFARATASAGQSSSVSVSAAAAGAAASTVSKSALAGQLQQHGPGDTGGGDGGDLVEVEQHKLQVLDQNTFDVLSTHHFPPNEFCLSILSTRFKDDPNIYYVVGLRSH